MSYGSFDSSSKMRKHVKHEKILRVFRSKVIVCSHIHNFSHISLANRTTISISSTILTENLGGPEIYYSLDMEFQRHRWMIYFSKFTSFLQISEKKICDFSSSAFYTEMLDDWNFTLT